MHFWTSDAKDKNNCIKQADCCYVSLQHVSLTIKCYTRSVLASSKDKGINRHKTLEYLVIPMVSSCSVR